MAKPVEGFMSEAGVFFSTLAEAELHDAELAIRAKCAKADRFIELIEAMADLVGEYVRAYKEVNKTRKNTVGLGGDQGNDRRGSTDVDAMEQQSSSGHEPMSNVGNSS